MNDYQVYNLFRRKRLRDHQDVDEEFYAPYKRRREDDDDEDQCFLTILTAASTSVQKRRKKRGPNKNRRGAEWWDTKYRESSPEEFKKSMRINRDTFNIILHHTKPHIEKQPTNFNPTPI